MRHYGAGGSPAAPAPGEGSIASAARADLEAIKVRDPACPSYTHAFLFFKGFQGLQAQRVSNWLWFHDRRVLACTIQSSLSEVFGMDLHPAARFGRGILIDPATVGYPFQKKKHVYCHFGGG